MIINGTLSFDNETLRWWFECGNCMKVTPLDDHTITCRNREITVSPGTVCQCGEYIVLLKKAA